MTDKVARPADRSRGAQPTEFEPVTTRISMWYLFACAVVHVFTAAIVSALLAQAIWGEAHHADNFKFVFPFAYVALVAVSGSFFYLNGRWSIDDESIYRGLTRCISLAEIEQAQQGIPESLVFQSTFNPLVRVFSKHMHQSALLVKLTGNRWFVWQFIGMANKERFVAAVLAKSPVTGRIQIPTHVARRLSISKVGQIVQCG